MKSDWRIKAPCPGCDQEITFDLSKTTARCPRCGPIKVEGNAAAETRKVDRMLNDFMKKIGKGFK